MKICDACRKKLSKNSLDAIESVTSELNPPTPTSSQATESVPLLCHGSETVSSFNVCLEEVGKTPVSKSRAKTVDRKYKRLLKLYHRGTY